MECPKCGLPLVDVTVHGQKEPEYLCAHGHRVKLTAIGPGPEPEQDISNTISH